MELTREGVGSFGVKEHDLPRGLRSAVFDCMLDMTLEDMLRA